MKETSLLDGNVLVALVLDSHVHHSICRDWFSQNVIKFSTCSVTQGTLLRLHMKFAQDCSSQSAWQTLQTLVSNPMHEFWDTGLSYTEVSPKFIQGQRQVTDAWLAEVARRKKGKLVTLDKTLSRVHSDVSIHIPIV